MPRATTSQRKHQPLLISTAGGMLGLRVLVVVIAVVGVLMQGGEAVGCYFRLGGGGKEAGL